MTWKINQLTNILDNCGRRNLTIFGKREIINNIIISKLHYNASIIPNPSDEIFKQLNGKIFNFVHNSKHRRKRNRLIGKESRCGINIIDDESKFSFLKASWIARPLSSLSKFLEHNFQKDNMSLSYIIKTNLINVE
jgi:hypothetical protein